jgi:hypothetical protein
MLNNSITMGWKPAELTQSSNTIETGTHRYHDRDYQDQEARTRHMPNYKQSVTFTHRD